MTSNHVISVRRSATKWGPVLLGMCALASSAHCATRPIWELGIGLGAVALPAYRGAAGNALYVLPLPYVVYRGRFLRSDKQGIRGVFYQNERFQLNLSADAGPPVQSGQIPARNGMPNLSPTFEIGPSFQYKLISRPDEQVELRWPIRAAFTFSMKAIGWVSSPDINLTLPDYRGSGWALSASLGPDFADRRYDAYFYNVPPVYARSSRPAYSAAQGYSGSSLLLTVSRRFAHYWVGAYIRYDNLAGASFVNSPLVESEQYVACGFGVSWIFASSSHLVPSGGP